MAIPWTSVLSRTLVFSLLWWGLTGGQELQWWLGVPAIILATASSFALLPPSRFVWHRFFSFLPMFLVRSLIGATDVAWRAFHPALPIDPVLVQYPLRLSSSVSRVSLANVISLMPGTLSAELRGPVLSVHVLVHRPDIQAEISHLEERIARIFGEPIQTA